MNVNIGVSAMAVVRIEKWKKGGEKTVYEFPNVVLRSGLETFINRSLDLTASSWIAGNSCFLGTGTNTPSVNDTGLQNVDQSTGRFYTSFVRINMFEMENHVVSPGTWTYNWGEGEAQGTWTEIGLAFWDLIGSSAFSRGNANTYAFPFSRALIRDADGVPTSITVLPDEFLRVFYTTFAYLSKDKGATSVLFNGQPVALADKLHWSSSYWAGGSSSWARVFWNPLPSSSAFLNNAPSMGSSVSSYSRSVDLANKRATFLFQLDPGAEASYDSLRIRQDSVRWMEIGFVDPVNKPLVNNLSGSASITFSAKHWEVEQIGKVSGATATTMTFAGAGWTVDEHVGRMVGIVAGTGWGSMSPIVSNTADTLTISPAWHVMPEAGSLFEIRRYDY